MTTQTQETLEAVIANACMGLKQIAETESSLSRLEKNHILYRIDKIKNPNKSIKKQITDLNIIMHGIYDLVKDK